MFLERNYRFIRILFIVIPVIVFFWLLAKDFSFSGRLAMVYDFSQDSPFVKRPWPPGRLHDIEYDKKTRDYFQRMFVEPLTFDVQLPRKFKKATVQVMYKKDAMQPLRIGIRMHPDKWAWEIRDLDPISPPARGGVRGGGMEGWTVGEVRFDDLSRVDFSGRRLHFLLNAPGLFEGGREIAFTAIRVIAEKDPITFSNFLPRLWHWIWPV